VLTKYSGLGNKEDLGSESSARVPTLALDSDPITPHKQKPRVDYSPRGFVFLLLSYQTKRLKPTMPIPSISRARIAMPYWLKVGIPSKNTVLVTLQLLPLP
jgi:hypothetical protein